MATELPSSPAEEAEGSFDEDGESEEEEEEDANGEEISQHKKSRHAITGRGVTLAMLMSDGIVEHGEGLLTIDYLGKKFTADLLKNGKILWKSKDMMFNSPSAWAIHCKKLVNPSKKSGCGWASVKYKGKKLDQWKSKWFRKQKPTSINITQPSYIKEEKGTNAGEDEDNATQENGDAHNQRGETAEEPEKKRRRHSEKDKDVAVSEKIKERRCVKHHTLGRRSKERDPNTLVECTSFPALGRIQPFTISMTTNCLLLMDFHCHLTTSEVVGYLGGNWDPLSQHMSVHQAFPCRCRLGDKENAGIVEEEIKRNLDSRGLILVGWYHSHPTFPAEPSLRDIDSQMDYQLQLKGAGNVYYPCLGVVDSPYDVHQHKSKESQIKAFWVAPPPENKSNEYGMPMAMNFNISQDTYITQDVLGEMKQLVDFYTDEPDLINFQEPWHQSTTYFEKLKLSLAQKFPKDQTDGRFLEYIHNLLKIT